MEHTSTFPGVTPEAVFAEFTSSDFLVAFGTEVGVVSGDMELSSQDGVEVAAMPWAFPTDRDGIPSLARKILPPEVHLDWKQRWGPAGSTIPGTIAVALHGTPSATVDATTQLLAGADGTVYNVSTRVKTSLRWPLAGTVESTLDKDLVGWILAVQARVLRRRMNLPETA